MRAHQPGSTPIDIPETVPNPAYTPAPTPAPERAPTKVPEKVVLSENYIRMYWRCSPAKTGIATTPPDRWTTRCKGASFCNARCVRA